MANGNQKAAVAGLLAALLGGCQSIPLFSSLSRASQPRQDSRAVERNKSVLIEIGRQKLDQGNYGAAIDTFRVALATGEDAAVAMNGMGVAYAQLGRADVAESLFLRAQQRDPSNEKYAQNLRNVRGLAGQPMLADTNPNTPAGEPAAKPTPSFLSSNRIQRLSSQEVAVATVAGGFTGKLAEVSSARQLNIASQADERDKQAPQANQGAVAAREIRGFMPIVRIDLSAVKARTVTKAPVRTAGQTVQVDSRFKPLVRIDLEDRMARPARQKQVSFALTDRGPL